MIRIASLLILVGMVPLMLVLLDTSGATATRFTFVGTPAIAAGIALYVIARLRGRSA